MERFCEIQLELRKIPVLASKFILHKPTVLSAEKVVFKLFWAASATCGIVQTPPDCSKVDFELLNLIRFLAVLD